jgi:predicted RNase H-like HicB family nuclease
MALGGTIAVTLPVCGLRQRSFEAPWFVARCLEVEVASQGESVEEALANLQEALELYFEDEQVPDGIEPPMIATVEVAA